MTERTTNGLQDSILTQDFALTSKVGNHGLLSKLGSGLSNDSAGNQEEAGENGSERNHDGKKCVRLSSLLTGRIEGLVDTEWFNGQAGSSWFYSSKIAF